MPDAAAVALAAECLGGAQYVMESAVEYAKTRIQFGRAIGSFQAIKHKCADMLLSVEAARSALWYARAASTTEDVTLMRLASSIAKATCGEAYMHCAAGNIQVHGGIGFIWEHFAHLFYKRARANSLMFGSSRQHRARVADLLDL
ncbi:acyl-CoA dehydrogenase family protein [Streptomyces sp. NPDC001982]|uniref:acyl-CoA dehydrogenase family protein n=1 Tax=Streptomyces sp. NPDC001982 TaxID=3154405 RepID=UPI0033248E87